jgi:beta-phosphoglucomutase-like phosphatase (HAD superfamily)
MMKAVLFDLDGTLIDTAADFIRIIQQMCRDEDALLLMPILFVLKCLKAHVRWSNWSIQSWM